MALALTTITVYRTGSRNPRASLSPAQESARVEATICHTSTTVRELGAIVARGGRGKWTLCTALTDMVTLMTTAVSVCIHGCVCVCAGVTLSLSMARNSV